MTKATIFKLEDKITFGKYSTKELPVVLTIQEIIDQDPDYIAWAVDEVKGFELDDKAFQVLDDAMLSIIDKDYPESVLWS